jgi:hypothetical protein
MKHQLKDTPTELWTIKMADSDYVYLKKLVKVCREGCWR